MQHLILLTLIMLIVGLSFTVIKWRGGLHMTFSQHAAVNRTAIIFYSLLFICTLPILITFFTTWYIPEHNLPGVFLWFAVVSALFQVLCTWFPENGGTNTKTHRALTGISGITLLPMMIIIATAPSFTTLVRAIAWAALVVMIVLLIIALRHQDQYRYALLLQVGYYSTFFITIVVSTYL